MWLPSLALSNLLQAVGQVLQYPTPKTTPPGVPGWVRLTLCVMEMAMAVGWQLPKAGLKLPAAAVPPHQRPASSGSRDQACRKAAVPPCGADAEVSQVRHHRSWV